MPYWGKTETEVDDHGGNSVKVCYPNESNPITIALHIDGLYIVLHNDNIYFAEGKIALCKTVEGLPQSLGFGQSEKEVIAALNDYMVATHNEELVEYER